MLVRTLAATLLLLSSAMLTGCGDEGSSTTAAEREQATSAPPDRSRDRSEDEQEFCTALNDVYEALANSDADTFDAARNNLSQMVAPSVIAGEAREGYELFVDGLADIDANELSATEVTLPGIEKKKIDAFGNAYFTLCMDEATEDGFDESE